MENKSLKQIIANRLEKLDKIRQLGVNPYPYEFNITHSCLLYTSPSPRDATLSRMPSSA